MRNSTLLAVAGFAALLAAPALAQNGPPPGGQRPDPAATMKALDKNGDGAISKAEWTGGGRPEAAFDRIDANHDGKITLAELSAPRQRPAGGGGGN